MRGRTSGHAEQRAMGLESGAGVVEAAAAIAFALSGVI